jgi:hypothetical protein
MSRASHESGYYRRITLRYAYSMGYQTSRWMVGTERNLALQGTCLAWVRYLVLTTPVKGSFFLISSDDLID